MTRPLLNVSNLSVDYILDKVPLRAINDISFNINKGSSMALVGESGCGKTSVMLSLMRLLPAQGRIVSGEVKFEGRDLLLLSEPEMRSFRWRKMSIIFQGAMSALNPVRKVGEQIAEPIWRHGINDKRTALQRVEELLEMVGVSPSRANQYPHQYSGGMRQRAMIAMALACSPDILIADEPTTALDVMVQAQLLELFQELLNKLSLSIIMVTHDLGVVAEICDYVLVMYSGRAVETGSVDTIYNNPLHPYTQRLIEAFPDIDNPSMELASIEGYPPILQKMPPGCCFEPRCHCRMDVCLAEHPEMVEVVPGHWVACHSVRD
jgi:peptide/nickel transport system ATP-binding protein